MPDRQPRPIALVGMPGAGKTSVGRALAARLGWHFVDSDEMVVVESGRSIDDFFLGGEVALFRERERDAIMRLASQPNIVIATGGGAMTIATTHAILLAETVTVWLQASPETLVKRLVQSPPRPLLHGPGLLDRLRVMAAEREPHYAAADLHVATNGITTEEVTARVLAMLAG